MKSIYKSAMGREAVHALYRRALAPVARSRTPNVLVPTCQGDTFVIATGDAEAPPLVLLHGSGANSSIWLREIAALSRDHRVVRGRHDWRTGLQRRDAAAARLGGARRVARRCLERAWRRAREPSSACRSAGGLPIDYAIRRPHNVSTLSLIAPSGIGRQNHVAAGEGRAAAGPWRLGKTPRASARLGLGPVAARGRGVRRRDLPPLPSEDGAASVADGRGACRVSSMPVQLILGRHRRA